MGAYLAKPKTDKESSDAVLNDLLVVGTSSMQGWRNNQEDAHNAILEFDTNTSYFAVYDGHGGAEVAAYCADKLPEFLKSLESYKRGELEQALKDAFLGFDQSLLEPQVVEILKILAQEKNEAAEDGEEEEEDDENLVELHEESHLPLGEVMEKYQGHPMVEAVKRIKDAAGGGKPQSPYLRGRRAAAIIADAANKRLMDPEGHPAGSSTSAAALAGLADDAPGPSSSRAATLSGSRMETDEGLEDSTVSSSSSSASGSKANKQSSAISAEATASNAKPHVNGDAAASSSSTSPLKEAVSHPDSSHSLSNKNKENEQNGSVTSSEAAKSSASTPSKTATDVSTSSSPDSGIKSSDSSTATGDSTVSGSNEAGGSQKKQNGNVGSSSSATTQEVVATGAAGVENSAISSTSKGAAKRSLNASGIDGEDDADYQPGDDDEQVNLAGDEDDDEDEDDEVESSDDDDDDVEDEEEDDEIDDEELEEDDDEDVIAQKFCTNLIEEPGQDSGCTAVVALLHGRDLYVANAGDSRCVVCRAGAALDMSEDHKPEDDEESARIIKAGGLVTPDGRVNGGLNLSRAIGDHAYKQNKDLPPEEQMISALPDIRKLIISPEDEFMILACDGIWNYMSSSEVVNFIRERLVDETRKISQILEELFDHCLAPNTHGDGTGCDNMTAVLILFKPKIYEQPTTINPAETADQLISLQTVEEKPESEGGGSRKRSLPSLDSDDADDDDDDEDDEDSNEATILKTKEPQSKRLKTDEASPVEMASTTIKSLRQAGEVATSSSSSNGNSNTITEKATAEPSECDSVSMETTSTSPQAESSAVSST